MDPQQTSMTAGQLPPSIRAAITRIDQELAGVRRWMDGRDDEATVDTSVWVPDTTPGREGYLKEARRKTIGEVHAELLAVTGRHADGLDSPVVDGAAEYFSVTTGVDPDREWPEGRIVAFAVTGGSEGHYVHVEVIGGTVHARTAELLILGKTFEGPDAAWNLARRLAGILGV